MEVNKKTTESTEAVEPLFPKSIPINTENVAIQALKYWNLTLGELIKKSQNYTFHAKSADNNDKKFILRVTPDLLGTHVERIRSEIKAVQFFSSEESLKGLIPPPVSTNSGDLLVYDKENLIVLCLVYESIIKYL